MRNYKKYFLGFAIAISFAANAVEVTGKTTFESAVFSNSGTSIGDLNKHSSGDAFKNELSTRIYIDGELKENPYHIELQGFYDASANAVDRQNPDGGMQDKVIYSYKENEAYTQRDPLREAYIDFNTNGINTRLGKQQVVWGTADGMKLLDMINPTDFSEVAQNQMEDSRIPVWMINSEKALDNGGNFQVILAEPKENIFAGLNRNIHTGERTNNPVTSLTASPDIIAVGQDQGHPFIMKGPDSITGRSNGFLNIVPDLGSVATMFGMAFGTTGAANGLNPANHGAMNGFTVGAFNSSTSLKNFSASYKAMVESSGAETALAYGGASGDSNVNGFEDLIFGTTAFWTTDSDGDTVAKTHSDAGTGYSGQQALGGFAALLPVSNLQNTDAAVNSVFEYMDRTPFSTFNAFVGAKSKYVYNMPDAGDADVALKYSNTTSSGSNYSLNYAYAYDKNPIINLTWQNSQGERIFTCKSATGLTSDNEKYLVLQSTDSTTCSAEYGGHLGNVATLVFEQEVKKIHNIGGSYDTTIETESYGPVVLRAEALYQKGTYSPVIDRGALSIGDMTKALTMRKGDRFKYVIGADITALTNMMVSFQFIQDINLDYVEKKVDHDGTTRCIDIVSSNCGVYTTDYATMHMSNQFNKAEETKEFVSIYLSKPFGESGQHRWNNITIAEENGGFWNRLDAEYTLSDSAIATVEFNNYWGDDATQFGQLEKSSNVQVGMKYSF